jgi:hypothetical protein
VLQCCNGTVCQGQCVPPSYGTSGDTCQCSGSDAGCTGGLVCCGALGCVYPDTCINVTKLNDPCNGAKCWGWCEWLPDGTKACNCFGIVGGCQGNTHCSTGAMGCADGPVPQGGGN